MIFSNNYDKSLWLIVSGNKTDRILDFINNIPEELLKEIQISLEVYKLYLYKNKGIPARSREKIYLHGTLKTQGDMLYWYNINSITGALNMGECIDDEEETYDNFRMTLYPFKKEYFRSLGSLDTYILGDISYNFFNQGNIEDETRTHSETTDFTLIKLPIDSSLVCCGDMIPTINESSKVTFQMRNRYNLVHVNCIPYDYNITRLNSKSKVRRRKINSK